MKNVETVIDAFSEIIKQANREPDPASSSDNPTVNIINLAKKGMQIYTDQHGDKAQLQKDKDSYKI